MVNLPQKITISIPTQTTVSTQTASTNPKKIKLLQEFLNE